MPDVWHNRLQHVVFQFHLLRHDVVQLPWLLVTFLNLGRTLQAYPKLQVVYIPSMVGIQYMMVTVTNDRSARGDDVVDDGFNVTMVVVTSDHGGVLIMVVMMEEVLKYRWYSNDDGDGDGNDNYVVIMMMMVMTMVIIRW